MCRELHSVQRRRAVKVSVTDYFAVGIPTRACDTFAKLRFKDENKQKPFLTPEVRASRHLLVKCAYWQSNGFRSCGVVMASRRR